MTFYDQIGWYRWDEVTQIIGAQTTADVERVLVNGIRKPTDFMALVSPAAAPMLETMAQKSHALTCRRFGNVIQLYVPLYLSNYCENRCVYCGFNAGNRIARKVLSLDELADELTVVKQHPFQHLLLVTGEAPKKAAVHLDVAVIRLFQLLHELQVELVRAVQVLAEGRYGNRLLHRPCLDRPRNCEGRDLPSLQPQPPRSRRLTGRGSTGSWGTGELTSAL